VKFPRLLGGPCGCRAQSKNRKSVDRVPSKSRPKYAKKPNFKPPYLPEMGADSPKLKTIFIRVKRAISRRDQMGVRAPKGGKPPKCSTPQFLTPHFFETPLSDFSQKLMGGDPISEVSKFALWSRSVHREWRKGLQFLGFFGFGGKTPFASRELDPQFAYAQSCTTNGGKNSDPR